MLTRIRPYSLAIAALIISGAGHLHVQGATFTDLVVFGDSLSDTGNEHDFRNGVVPQSPPYFQGRNSNGPLWVEHLASELGIPVPVASRLGGNNFAYGGAQTGNGASTNNGVPNVGSQIAEFLDAGETFSDTDLISLWAGHVDRATGIDPTVVVDNLVDHITTLHANGAQSFILGNIWREQALNASLDQEFKTLEQELSISISLFDFNQLMSQVQADPRAFGFTDASTPALNLTTGEVVPNPDEYARWDIYWHPTAPFHQIIGELALASVTTIPEPSAFALGLAASVFLLSSCRRQR